MDKLSTFHSCYYNSLMEMNLSSILAWLTDPISSSYPNSHWPLSPVSSFFMVLLTIALIIKLRERTIYLVDYVCYKPPTSFRVPMSAFMEHSTLMGCFTEESLKFQKLILERSGLGEETALPPGLWYLPPRPTLENARDEAEAVIFDSVQKLLDSTGVQPRDIGILVMNCSLFTPVPSLCAMVINKFKLRSDIKSYQLAGMGCSASAISLSLAQNMLKVHRNSYALIISTENITKNWYTGNRRSMAIPNCLFRVGGAAILLSNRSSDGGRSKYKLQNIVRTITGSDDKSYLCVYQEQDDQLNTGVTLSKDLTKVAGEALRQNITRLGPMVLPISEQLAYLISHIVRKIRADQKLKPYVPDFKKAFDHFCIHAGGRAIIDELEKALKLRPEHVEASRMTLHRFANTSSSSIWYELSYLEAKQRVKPGHVIWQIAFGSGFKCNSVVWSAMPSFNKRIKASDHNPWRDCIFKYPVDISF